MFIYALMLCFIILGEKRLRNQILAKTGQKLENGEEIETKDEILV